MRLKFLIGAVALFTASIAYADSGLMIQQNHLVLTLMTFFGLGVLLAFTPCVLPMVPILSAILVGQSEMGTKRAFRLSFVFVFSMAITYAVAGMMAGYLGSTVQTLMQTPFIILSFSLIFVLMALSMFGWFNLSLPNVLQTRLHLVNNKLKSGSYVGVAIMGVLSTLIASPCVTAPLVSVLAYISQTGSAIQGGLILFVLALGMGMPLILFGIGQSTLLPKTGNWMNTIKSLFGVMMLGLAIWISSRVLSGNVTLFLWSALFIISAVIFGALDFQENKRTPIVVRGISVLALAYGLVLLVGAASGNENLFRPLATINTVNTSSTVSIRPPSTLFQYATTQEMLNEKLAIAQKAHKPVMVEFFASWCPDCKQVDRDVLSDKEVQKKVRSITAIRVDVSERNPALAQIMEHYKVVGVPTMILFDANGKMLDSTALNTNMTKEGLLKALGQL